MRFYFIFLCVMSTFIPLDGQAGGTLRLHGNHFDEALMVHIIELFHPDTLIETGTHNGATASAAARYFNEVHTIEIGAIYHQAKQRFANSPTIHCYQGDSGKILTEVISNAQGRIIFWLDAHASGGVDDRGDRDTPLVNELQCIKNAGLTNAIILIDDIRACHPRADRVPGTAEWLSIQELKAAVLEIDPSYEFWIIGDMAIAFPKNDKVVPSELVKACTESRFCKQSDPFTQSLIEYEKVIAYSNTQESEVLDQLYKTFANNNERQAYHYILWKGLKALGANDKKLAKECFQRVLDFQYTHPRVYHYLEECLK